MIDQRDAVEGRTVHAKAGSQVREMSWAHVPGSRIPGAVQISALCGESSDAQRRGESVICCVSKTNGEEKPFVALDP
jgi:hypothetical protein